MHGDLDDREPTPRWVKIGGVAVAALVLLLVVLHLTGNSPGGHGP
ncbi:MAG TPA: hypothetical protein VHH36_00575 [Candidatus Thermoplasmatota archaeon]|nr:hypothetical protein [Candidatus Thermoplasmatota archaeon]